MSDNFALNSKGNDLHLMHHGAWEAALMNTLSPGDRILVPQTGNFSNSWKMMAESLGLEAVEIPTDWRHAADPGAIETILRDDKAHAIKAILQVHVDTATSVISDIETIRAAIDAAQHPALLMVDTIASLITTDFRMDDWGVDVAVGAGQKGLMLPPGLSFTAVSEKALAANRSRLTELETSLADETLYTDSGRKDELTQLVQDQAAVKSTIESLEWEWLEVSEKLEQAT